MPPPFSAYFVLFTPERVKAKVGKFPKKDIA
jgi:hypothetical protein